MAASVGHGIAKYNAGCRCDVCKKATSDYHRERRRRIAESVGNPGVPAGAGLRLLNTIGGGPVTSGNADSLPESAAGSVFLGVQAEIDEFGGAKRPALAAAALALAEVLDNPKATATKPAAAAKLSDLLEQMRKGADNRESRLARVRRMTKPQVKTG